MSTIEHLQAALKKGHGQTLPDIRYFNGTEKFSTPDGKYSAKTLEDSIKAYLREYYGIDNSPSSNKN